MGHLATAIESYQQWLEENEERGTITFTASCRTMGGTDVTMEVGRHTVRADEPRSLGGGGTAPTPVGYLIAALGTCVAIGLSYWSDILDVPFEAAEVRLMGEIHPAGAYALREGVSPSFSDLALEVRISGSESQERYELLVAKVEKYSPLLDTLRKPMPVSTRMTLVHAGGATPAK